MEVLDIIYSATIRDTEYTKVVVTTMLFGGTYTWYAKRLNYQNGAFLEEIECDPASYWLTSQDALDAGIVSVMGGEELDDTGTFTGKTDAHIYLDHCAGICGGNCEFCPDDGYAYENLPTGWDAANHKALYE